MVYKNMNAHEHEECTVSEYYIFMFKQVCSHSSPLCGPCFLGLKSSNLALFKKMMGENRVPDIVFPLADVEHLNIILIYNLYVTVAL